MLTADTITDEQIRELRNTAWDQCDTSIEAQDVAASCSVALSKPRDPTSPLASGRAAARARCAEILNARAKEAK